jgi:hypothetical protein
MWYFPHRNQCVGTKGYSVLRLAKDATILECVCVRPYFLALARPYLTTHGAHTCGVNDFGIYARNNRFMPTRRSYQGDLGGKFPSRRPVGSRPLQGLITAQPREYEKQLARVSVTLDWIALSQH